MAVTDLRLRRWRLRFLALMTATQKGSSTSKVNFNWLHSIVTHPGSYIDLSAVSCVRAVGIFGIIVRRNVNANKCSFI